MHKLNENAGVIQKDLIEIKLFKKSAYYKAVE
jgi:hypothetical protein